jgi:glucan biosynthesis protein C
MTRRHDIDALRVIAFGFLILYHCAMLWVAEWEWHLKSSYIAEWLQLPMIALNRWRMPLLFLLSGIAVGLFRPERVRAAFFGSRSWRLLLPLAFGIVAIVPIQAYCQGVRNGLVEPGFLEFMLRYLQFQPWPEGAFDGAEYGFTWNHLWYLPYLWAYTGVLMLLVPVLGADSRPARWLKGLGGVKLVLLPALYFAVCLATLGSWFESTHALVDDWFNHANYFVVFVFGYWIANDAVFWQRLNTMRGRLLAVCLISLAVYLPLLVSLGDEPHELALNLARLLRGIYSWTALLSLLAWAHHLLNRPWRWLPYASEAVYPWYILHQSATVLLAYWLVPMELGPATEALLVIAGTIAICAIVHELLVRRINWLRPLFGLKSRPKQRVNSIDSDGTTATRASA